MSFLEKLTIRISRAVYWFFAPVTEEDTSFPAPSKEFYHSCPEDCEKDQDHCPGYLTLMEGEDFWWNPKSGFWQAVKPDPAAKCRNCPRAVDGPGSVICSACRFFG